MSKIWRYTELWSSGVVWKRSSNFHILKALRSGHSFRNDRQQLISNIWRIWKTPVECYSVDQNTAVCQYYYYYFSKKLHFSETFKTEVQNKFRNKSNQIHPQNEHIFKSRMVALAAARLACYKNSGKYKNTLQTRINVQYGIIVEVNT